MEYTVSQLAKLSGVSSRTLRYYDQIHLLKPLRLNTAGYRIYGHNEVVKLQQILLFKALEIPLETIGNLMNDEDFNEKDILEKHMLALIEKRKQLDQLINNVNASLRSIESGDKMSDQARFEGLKKDLIKENEQKYGNEIRGKYGEESIDETNKKFLNLTEEGYKKMNALGESIISELTYVMEHPDAFDCKERERNLYQMHKDWIMIHWSTYSPEGHKGLGEMYVADERFKNYYDQHKEGMAEKLRLIINTYAQ